MGQAAVALGTAVAIMGGVALGSLVVGLVGFTGAIVGLVSVASAFFILSGGIGRVRKNSRVSRAFFRAR